MSDPFRHLADHENERALAYVAVSDFIGYRTLGVTPDQFDSPLYRKIVGLAETVFEDVGQVDGQLQRVLTRGHEDEILTPGDRDKAIDWLSDKPLATYPDAEKLRRQHQNRLLDEAFTVAQRVLRNGHTDEAVGLFDQARADATKALYEGLGIRDGGQWMEHCLDGLTRRRSEPGLSLGLPRFKGTIGNVAPGTVIVIGGNTNVGKSAVILEMMWAAVLEQTACGLISMEDLEFNTGLRLMAMLAGVSARALLNGEHFELAVKAAEEVRERAKYIYEVECLGMNEADVCARMSAMAHKGVKLVVVDYIGEIQASVQQQDRRNEMRWIMKRLKAHAARLGLVLVVVSQFARPKDGNPNYKPSKHSLKEAGDLENAADYIVLLWRETEDDFAPVKLLLAKSKMGSVGAQWEMQREQYAEDSRGNRTRGSHRLREVDR